MGLSNVFIPDHKRRWFWSWRKRLRLNRKTPAHFAGFGVNSRSRVWKRLRHVTPSSVSIADHKRRRSDQDDGGYNLDQVRTGVG